MSQFLYYYRLFFNYGKGKWLAVNVLMLAAAIAELAGVFILLPIMRGGGEGFEVLPISLAMWLALIVVAFCLRALFLILTHAVLGRIEMRLFIGIRNKLLSKIFQANYLYLTERGTGFMTNVLTQEFSRMMMGFRLFSDMLLSLLFATLYLIGAAACDMRVVGVLAAVAFPLSYVIRFANKKTQKVSDAFSRHLAFFQKSLIQALENIKYLKSTHTHHAVLHKTQRENAKLGALNFKQHWYLALTRDGFAPLAIIFIAGLLWVEVSVRGHSIASACVLIVILKRFIDQALRTQSLYQKFLSVTGSIEACHQCEMQLNENKESDNEGLVVESLGEVIEFKNVSFVYPHGQHAIKNVSFSIMPRQSIAFVGPSGCGKSTLTSLISGILKPSQGKMFLGGKPFAEMNAASFRQKMGYVTQENMIFNDTLKNNITLWNPNIPSDDLEAAIQKSMVGDFIKNLPQGMETVLGDQGIRLSGGERQRVGIARELLKDVDLLILDEATSALDSITESMIQKNIENMHGEITVVLIAHRLSTVKHCDVIYVMNHGEIVESGTYDDLYRRGGQFRKLADVQMLESS